MEDSLVLAVRDAGTLAGADTGAPSHVSCLLRMEERSDGCIVYEVADALGATRWLKLDELPLGLVNASLTWGGGTGARHVLLDGRCTAADGCPRAQGFYHRGSLALPLDMADGRPEEGAELTLTVIPRAGDVNGSEFSLVTVIGEV